MAVTYVGITLVTFVIVRAAPGVLGVAGLGEAGGLEAEKMQAIREQQRKLLHLDRPFYVQYPIWLARSLVLDFDVSRTDFRPVREKILQKLPITLFLNLITTIVIYVITIPLGIYSATHERGLLDKFITLLLYMLYSLPVPFVGLVLIITLAKGGHWGVFPVSGIHSLGHEDLPFFAWLADVLWHCVLPIVCLTYGGLAFLSRFQRNNMLEVLRQDYIRTARAKGLSERTVIYKHALRNALIPLVTLFGLLLPGLISGAVITETIFGIDGMGRLAFQAVLMRDINTVMAVATISAVLTLIGLLVVDLLYVVIDPRVSLE